MWLVGHLLRLISRCILRGAKLQRRGLRWLQSQALCRFGLKPSDPRRTSSLKDARWPLQGRYWSSPPVTWAHWQALRCPLSHPKAAGLSSFPRPQATNPSAHSPSFEISGRPPPAFPPVALIINWPAPRLKHPLQQASENISKKQVWLPLFCRT